MQDKNIESFIGEVSAALQKKTFAKATVGNYKGPKEQLQKVLLRQITTRRGELLQFVFRYGNKDIAKNFDRREGLARLASLFEEGFRSARLFATDGDIQIEMRDRKSASVSRSEPTFKQAPNTAHNKNKERPIGPDSDYLKALGVSTPEGRVKDKQQAKFRQINRFVLILEDLLCDAAIQKDVLLNIADMGSGKGYLTFALYDHLKNNLGIDVRIKGIEERPHLVETCNAAARACGFADLKFEAAKIDSAELEDPDVLIALHACDTATDDALFRGIRSRSKVIVVAPCCHKELRRELRFPDGLSALNKYGLLLERETESVTDGIRAVLLEHSGYNVRMFEFVAPEHTPKNNLIAAVLSDPAADFAAPCPDAQRIMKACGVRSQMLESLLAGRA
jgi:hypothetical protein